MKNRTVILLCLMALIIGYVVADFMAYKMAKTHNTKKFGGIFTIQPDGGVVNSGRL